MEIHAVSHVHSKWSYDGSWLPEALAAKFSRGGYRVLMMTEHDRGFNAARLNEYRDACSRASSDKILVMPGIEYSDPANRVHVLVWGPVPFLGEGLCTTEMLAAVKASNGVAVLAHPSRREAWKAFEPSWADALLGIEIWNRKYDGWSPSRTSPALLSATNTIPFVGLDFHTQRQSFPLGMVLDIEGAVSEKTVLESLRSRRCQARAFKLPLDQFVIRGALPVLKIAERSRRMAAIVAKRSRGVEK